MVSDGSGLRAGVAVDRRSVAGILRKDSELIGPHRADGDPAGNHRRRAALNHPAKAAAAVDRRSSALMGRSDPFIDNE